MKKLILSAIIAVLCGVAAGEFISCYFNSGDRSWLVFSFLCLVCFFEAVFIVVDTVRS